MLQRALLHVWQLKTSGSLAGWPGHADTCLVPTCACMGAVCSFRVYKRFCLLVWWAEHLVLLRGCQSHRPYKCDLWITSWCNSALKTVQIRL